MDIVQELILALRNKDASRSRSVQTQIGPSELGGCSRKVWFRINSHPVTNENNLKLAAIMGTAIHTEIEAALTRIDPDKKRFWLETEVEYGDMKAHIDCYMPEEKMIVDWKTIKTKTAGYFPSTQQRWQVQVYGYLMIHGGGKPVDKVALVAICRDGDERDVILHEEPYDESIALEAFAWLQQIRESETAPAAEKDAMSYCRFYCNYYDESGEIGCTGLKKADAPMVRIAEGHADVVAKQYWELDQTIKDLTKRKDGLKEELEGYTGETNSGYQISWTSVAGRKTVDSAEVEKVLGYVPYKVGKESLRLEVKATTNEGEEASGIE